MRNNNLLNEIEAISGSGTNLVSLYVPPSKRLQSVINRLQSEYAEADYIKSKSTRQAVQRGLTLAINELQKIETEPVHGLVCFAGVDSDDEEHVYVIDDLGTDIGDSDTESSDKGASATAVESFIYHCDSEFRTEELREQLDDREVFDLVVIERRNATIGVLRGETIEHVRDLSSDAKGKHSAGGFSQGRFERVEEEATQGFYDEVATAIEIDLHPEDECVGLLVGGTTVTTDEFQSELASRTTPPVLGVVSVATTGAAGLRQLVDRSADVIDRHRDRPAVEAIETFFRRLRESPELVEYGMKPVERAAGFGAIDELLVGSGKGKSDGVEQLIEDVEQQGGSVTRIPDTFEKGFQFNGAFDGIGALLRFPVGNDRSI